MSFKLTYFDLKGAAEPIRLLFKYANVPFEDCIIKAQTWEAVKTNYKWQKVPFLETDGKMLSQTSAILGYLGNKFNLNPKDAWEQARCDEIVGAVNDLRNTVKPLNLSKLGGPFAMENSKEFRDQMMATVVPLYLKNLNEILEENHKLNNKSDFILGGEKPTPADFWLANFTDQWQGLLSEPKLLDQYVYLKKQLAAVYSLPGVKEWIAIRPQTPI